MAARRRQRSPEPTRSRALDRRRRSKLDPTIERHLVQIKTILNDLQRAVDTQSKRTAAIQAQVDHLDAKARGT